MNEEDKQPFLPGKDNPGPMLQKAKKFFKTYIGKMKDMKQEFKKKKQECKKKRKEQKAQKKLNK